MQVLSTYNRIAPYFSRSRTLVWPDIRKHLHSLKPGARVVDLGCGNGRLLNGILQKIDYLGIDFSPQLIKEARKLHPQNKFIVSDITDPQLWQRLPLFDAVYCVSVLHHIEDREQQLQVLRQIKKHLKPQGTLYLSVWNLIKLSRIPHHFKNHSLSLKLKNWRYINTLFQNKWPMFCFTFDRYYLLNLAKEAGLSGLNCYYVNRSGAQTGVLQGQNLCLTSRRGRV